MKKLLLSLLSFVVAVSTSMAFDLTPKLNKEAIHPRMLNSAPTGIANQQSRAGDGYTIRFCGNPYNWLTLGAAGEMVMYIPIPAQIATKLAGNKITSIGYSVSFDDNATAADTRNATIFVAEDHQGEMLASKQVIARDSYLLDAHYQTGSFDEGTEYVIKENTPFIFGIRIEATANDCIVGCGNADPNAFAGFVDVYQNGKYAGYVNMASAGYNLFLFAKTVGEKTGLDNVFTIDGATLNDFTLPIVNGTTTLNPNVLVNNIGSNSLTSLDYEYSFNDAAPTSGNLTINVDGGNASWVEIPVGDMPDGRGQLNLTVTKINGIEMNTSASLPFMKIPGDGGYPRKFVVEEGTGTWCGWCPRGIVGLEYMSENHPDDFVGIAVHSGDQMEVDSYRPFISKFFSGFPSCVVNRDPVFDVDPSKNMLEAMWQWWSSQVAPAKIDLVVGVGETELAVKSTTTFAVDDNNPYLLAYVIIEDGIKGMQTNYYAGGSYGECGGWEKKGSKVTWEYEHTARLIKDTFGLESSKIPTVVANTEYVASTFLPLSNVKDVEKCKVIALLLDEQTGVIVNAAVKACNDSADGIESNVIDLDTPATYYNIQGVKVDNPRQGVPYIKVQNGKATKVTIQ